MKSIMKVKELLVILKKLDKEKEIFMKTDECMLHSIEKVEEKDGRYRII